MNFKTPRLKSEFEQTFSGPMWKMPDTYHECSYKDFNGSLREIFVRTSNMSLSIWDPRFPAGSSHAFALFSACKLASNKILTRKQIDDLMLINCLPDQSGLMTSMDTYHHTDVLLVICGAPPQRMNFKTAGVLAGFDLSSETDKPNPYSTNILLGERNFFKTLFSEEKIREIRISIKSHWEQLNTT